MLRSAFNLKTVLVTGHTGFKGSWLTAWLKRLGARVIGVALDPPTEPSHFRAPGLNEDITDLRIDIRDYGKLENAIVSNKPDFVFHLAAQSLVGDSYLRPLDTWQINLMGTLHVLEALRKLDKYCSVVMVTSDKCYDNVEWVWGYRETDALGGPDPYSSSKGAAELAIRSHIKSFFPQGGKVRIASARAGNVIGGGDWSLNRIVPDCVKAWSRSETVEIRNPESTRPWQHVLEPLSGYLSLAMALCENPDFHGESFNFGPKEQSNHSVLNLVENMAKHWEKVHWRNMSSLGGEGYESALLKLNCDKALHFLNWHATMDFESTVQMTAEWYRAYYKNPKDILSTTNSQIATYTAFAKRANLKWAR